MTTAPETARLIAELRDARAHTLALVQDLHGEQWIGPELEIVNPPLWEIGHVAWFQEYWMLRTARRLPPLRKDADAVYDSAAVEHFSRWRSVLPPLTATLRYLEQVLDGALAALAGAGGDPELHYFARLALYHEDMHGEALLYTRQTLGYPAPNLGYPASGPPAGGPCPGDVEIPGGRFILGAHPAQPFVFDNEKWAHAVEIAPFAIARAPVTEAEFAAFVDDGGYRRADLWSESGQEWRESVAAEQPVYWRRQAAGWSVREFDRWRALCAHRPVLHVNAWEAEAYCRWRRRRLPTEAEWELAACGPCTDPAAKRMFPWGDAPPAPARAQLDATALHCADVGGLADGDSPYGCRQMLGNVWEWTSSVFGPYPGFTPDPYREYSAPWFLTRRVLRGGSFATRGRLLRNTWRNFFTPDRRDVFAGFRTVAL